MFGNFLLERCFDLFFELIIIFSSISRKSSWENDDTIEDSLFVIDAVVDMSLESGSIVDEGLFSLCSVFDVVGTSNLACIRILWWL